MRKYSWNRNAAHHRIAIFRFVIASTFISTIVTLISTGYSLPDYRTQETYAIAAAAAVAVFLIVWLALFFVMTAAYYELCRRDETPLPQKPKPEPLKESPPSIAVYKDGNRVGEFLRE